MTDFALPRRHPAPFLPIPGTLLVDDPAWGYRPEKGGPAGMARLRVWRAVGPGYLAVVTQGCEDLSVTTAAPYIWQVLDGKFGPSLALAELWPPGQAGPLHLDLVVPPAEGRQLSWQRVFPAGPSHPLHFLMTQWWLLSADEILDGLGDIDAGSLGVLTFGQSPRGPVPHPRQSRSEGPRPEPPLSPGGSCEASQFRPR